MKKGLCTLLLCGMLISLAGCGGDSTPASETSQTSGASSEKKAETKAAVKKKDGVVQIETPKDLAEFAERVNAGETELKAVLENDIDLSSICGASTGSFDPIKSFAGEFDGNGHVIENLYCVQEKTATLFSELGGTVKNLRLENVVMESEEGSAAGIATGLHGRVENCFVSGSVKAYKYAGGIVLDMYRESAVSDCVNEAKVTGGYFNSDKLRLDGAAAGIAAWPREGGTITGCTNRGAIIGNGNMAAGIAGHCENGFILIENCVNEGSIQGINGLAELGSQGRNENYTGGIAGYAGENTAITKCVNNGSVSGTGHFTGGIAGASGNFIINCANHGNLEAAEGGYVYGITALAVNGLVNCYNTGDITCDGHGFGIGTSSSAVTINLYNYGTITCTATDGTLTDAFGWTSGGSTGLYNNYARENCIVVPDGWEDPLGIQDPNGVPDSQFTDGTILASLNDTAAYLNGDSTIEINGLRESAKKITDYEKCDTALSSWKAGDNGLPCFDWE